MPRIDFLIGRQMEKYWVQLDPKDYLIPMRENSESCFICVYPEPGDTRWLLGDAFLRGYYSVYDYEQRRFGFVPTPNSSKEAPQSGILPQNDLPKNEKL
jgi:hypothetical protein